MKLLVSDANIFIDMETGGLTRSMFELPETFIVPDILFIEELAEQHAELPAYGLQIRSLTSESVQYSIQLRQHYTQTSSNDLHALSLARQEQCPLLTGDDHLRKAAKSEGIEFHGTIWLVDRMLKDKIIKIADAVIAYDAMKQNARRLPWNEVNKQLEVYKLKLKK